ncbi:hypothetical protein FRC18_005477 [Serendipita sp. 400]|nr:hypothetical protein FRC18_005477 [Serendipita sp. 400]
MDIATSDRRIPIVALTVQPYAPVFRVCEYYSSLSRAVFLGGKQQILLWTVVVSRREDLGCEDVRVDAGRFESVISVGLNGMWRGQGIIEISMGCDTGVMVSVFQLGRNLSVERGTAQLAERQRDCGLLIFVRIFYKEMKIWYSVDERMQVFF